MEETCLSERFLNSLGPDTWDVAVIGAGPAGSAAAFGCASLGLRTVIIEKSKFPRDKVCGGCISPSGMQSLKQMGIDRQVRQSAVAIRTFALAAGGRMLRVELDQDGVAIGRDVLDSILLEHAVARGATARLGTSATLESVCADGCRLAVSDGKGTRTLNAGVVLVADGLAGTFLPRDREWSPQVASRSHFGVGARLDRDIGWALCEPGTIAMRCGKAGYVGAVRLHDGSVDVAAALAPDVTKKLGGPGNAIRTIAIESGLASAAESLANVRWRGTALLTRRRRVEGDRIFVVGDAAGYVEPFTGEGMSWAMAAGLGVATHARAVCSGGYRAGTWTLEWKRMTSRRRAACRMTSLALRHPALISASLALAGRLPAVCGYLASAISGPWRFSQSEPARA